MVEEAIAAVEAGEISVEIALARIVLAGGLEDLERLAAAAAPEAGPAAARLAALARRHRDRLPELSRLAAQGLDPVGADPVAATAELFDRLAGEAPDVAVAFYTLGDADLLAEATGELAAVTAALAPVDGADVLDFGCGTGRLAAALAPRARTVLGLDVSEAMIALARERTAGLANVRFVAGTGRSLAPAADASLDVIVAADSFPYLTRAGPELLDRHLAEAGRVLRPGGRLVVFNWSYRNDPAADAEEAVRLGGAHGLACDLLGSRPFRLWDATAFVLSRPPGRP